MQSVLIESSIIAINSFLAEILFVPILKKRFVTSQVTHKIKTRMVIVSRHTYGLLQPIPIPNKHHNIFQQISSITYLSAIMNLIVTIQYSWYLIASKKNATLFRLNTRVLLLWWLGFILGRLFTYMAYHTTRSKSLQVYFGRSYSSVKVLNWSIVPCNILDLIFFCYGREESFINLNCLLKFCELISSLKINRNKRSILGINHDASKLARWASMVGYKVRSFPFSYLGLLLVHTKALRTNQKSE